MMKTYHEIISADVFDIRDCIERFEELEPQIDRSAEQEQEMAELFHDLLQEVAGTGGDEQWRGQWYPACFIAESYFVEYAKDLAHDIGAISVNTAWPNRHIDWRAAADELRHDYNEINLQGVTYLYK